MTDAADYCRQIETYLCQKNEGHLVRIVGPAFEQVRAWAQQGVPLKVAFRGIDRYCERYYAKGARRRPVRIEFCEDDVLDAFEDWRRAVGVTSAAVTGEGPPGDEAETSAPRKPALASHIERAVARLTAARAGGIHAPAFDARLDALGRELDHLATEARHARGTGRAAIIERLAQLDRTLIDEAGGELARDVAERLMRDAAEEIAPFVSRMAPEARTRATEAARRRLVRETLGFPMIAFE